MQSAITYRRLHRTTLNFYNINKKFNNNIDGYK